jgi:dolichyl-phosphate-mannose-protein mannosyltransferase
MIYPKNHLSDKASEVKWVALCLFLLSLGFFTLSLGTPKKLYWDETIHVNAARAILYGEPSARDYPPLGREILLVSLVLFGDTPAGARGLSALCGAGGVGLIFLIARRLTQKTMIGVFTALLLISEPIFYLHSRLGMLDIFVTFFMILSFWIFLKIRERTPEQRLPSLYYLLGTALGLGFSIKMLASVLYPIFLADLVWSALKIKDPRRKKIHLLHLFAAFSLPTLIIFWGAYAVLGYSLTGIKDHLTWYYSFMSTFKGNRLIISKWYEWLIVKTPIWYLKMDVDKSHSVAVVATGNHLIWIGAEIFFVALLFCWRWVRKEIYFIHMIIVAQFVFWGIKPTTHIYYMTAVVPFYVLLIGVFLQCMMDRFPSKKKYIQFDTVVFLVCSFLIFGYYFPLLSGRPIKTEKIKEYLFPGVGSPAADSRTSQLDGSVP